MKSRYLSGLGYLATLAAAVFGWACNGCVRSGTVQPRSVVGSSDAGPALCGHLEAIGCPLGHDCAEVVNASQGAQTNWPIDCYMDAGTSGAAEACGRLKCARPIDGGTDAGDDGR